MISNNERLEPRLVPVDSYYLSAIDDMVQNLSNDADGLAMALNTIIANDDASKGVITAIRAALFHNSQTASDISDMLGALITQPRVEVNTYE